MRALAHKHLPAEYRAKDTWQRVAAVTTTAARGDLRAYGCGGGAQDGAAARGNCLPLKRPPREAIRIISFVFAGVWKNGELSPLISAIRRPSRAERRDIPDW